MSSRGKLDTLGGVVFSQDQMSEILEKARDADRKRLILEHVVDFLLANNPQALAYVSPDGTILGASERWKARMEDSDVDKDRVLLHIKKTCDLFYPKNHLSSDERTVLPKKRRAAMQDSAQTPSVTRSSTHAPNVEFAPNLPFTSYAIDAYPWVHNGIKLGLVFLLKTTYKRSLKSNGLPKPEDSSNQASCQTNGASQEHA